ncbi:sugar kinase [Sinomicrobium soli]|uniref:sugar kinase n=1 Tax=Sinomicrobium sp. N-1-3-6 TaxID=2219864 RepID=UPI000DCDC1A1|nr:sugar kinase [Sinomicrobium sp. N-1-3-6]RAV28189.1 sugar kinase [Sinomicrobium sp. N-1-3-6]
MAQKENHHKVVTFGEVLMRLSPPGYRKLVHSDILEYYFGGTEMNVAASLSRFGVHAQQITNVSDDLVGDAAISVMRGHGIDVSEVNRVPHPLGLYFLETGSGMRASRIAYNRLYGAFAHIRPEMVDWEHILRDADYLHWTGISPAISEGAYQTLKEGLEAANRLGVTVTADPAYRSNLWQYGRNGTEVLRALVANSHILIGGVNEINEILETDFDHSKDGFVSACKQLQDDCPNITKVFDKVRTGLSASWQKVYGHAWTGDEYISGEELEIAQVVDRIGTGDAFAAGVIYGLIHFEDRDTLRFANAACALKHTIPGDANLVSVEEVLEVMKGNTGGRIKR